MATSKAAHKAMAMDSRAKHNMDLDSKGKASSRHQHQALATSKAARKAMAMGCKAKHMELASRAWGKASKYQHQAVATSKARAMDKPGYHTSQTFSKMQWPFR